MHPHFQPVINGPKATYLTHSPPLTSALVPDLALALLTCFTGEKRCQFAWQQFERAWEAACAAAARQCRLAGSLSD
jgi:hypothetical protein